MPKVGESNINKPKMGQINPQRPKIGQITEVVNKPKLQ